MYETNNKYRCGWNPEPDRDDKEDKICDIDSKCCNGFVKEQFTIRATATPVPVNVYESSNDVFTRATVKVKNLSQTVAIRVRAQNLDRTIDPNQEYVFSANQLNVVEVSTVPPVTSTIIPSNRARVLFCFDLQFSSPEGCCPSFNSQNFCSGSDTNGETSDIAPAE